jgi:putative glutamine amidotransferase
MKPLIAVAGRIGARGKLSRDAVAFAGRRCLDAILRAGGEPAVLAPQPFEAGEAAALLRRFDGLLLMGGSDVNPARYHEQPHERVYAINDENDEFETTLARASLQLELPTLALCRGMQVINVALGGSLIQHLGDIDGLIDHGPPGGASPEGVPHLVQVAAGSHLAKAFDTDSPVIGNSYHHQAINRLGDQLTVVATTADGTIESVEYERGWVVGVQWHPEDTAMEDPIQQRLFDAFVEQARLR